MVVDIEREDGWGDWDDCNDNGERNECDDCSALRGDDVCSICRYYEPKEE